jgi:lipid-A-disaccharide synthase
VASSAEHRTQPPVIAMVAGEASGDLLGGELIGALRELEPNLRFVGIGGPRMERAGMEAIFPLEKLAVRGYVEVLRHLPEIMSIRRKLARQLLAQPPAAFVGIDAPDFNLALEARLKAHGIPTVHYVSPAIWMWRRERVRKIKRAVNRMLTVFPFEAAIYQEAAIDVAYVGHPLADLLANAPPRPAMREQLRLPAAAPIVALLPGSRQSELAAMADLFLDTARRVREKLPEALFIVPLATRETKAIFETAVYRNEMLEFPLTIFFGHAHEAMAAADIVLAAAGTATLEAALLRRPMVIAYRMPRASYFLLHGRNYLPYFGLPNILCGEFVVPEFIQDEATAENLAQALVNLLMDDSLRGRIERKFDTLALSLQRGAAHLAAQAVLSMVPRRTASM